ncbi:hypothetical protein Tco_1533711 [Tanacetum coccineum]
MVDLTRLFLRYLQERLKKAKTEIVLCLTNGILVRLVRRTAVQKGKGKVEHFGVKLEDTEEGEDSQEQPTLSHSTRTQMLHL